MKITKDMLIIDIINKYEKTIPMFMAFGMGCVGCLAAKGESAAIYTRPISVEPMFAMGVALLR